MNIQKYIEISNQWLTENRVNTTLITLERVRSRFNGGSLLSIEADAKTTKGSEGGYLTGILYLAPHSVTGFNVCPFAKTCIKTCLFNAGRGTFSNVSEARIIKTLMWMHDSERFKLKLIKDIKSLITKAKNRNMQPVIRLNGTSDLKIEVIFKDVLERFPDLQFYDYTKDWTRFKKPLPTNYDLTFSYDGTNWEQAERLLSQGLSRVAVVFEDKLPKTYKGFKVIDGDSTDLRFLDKNGVIVGLSLKGSSKNLTEDDYVFINKSA